MNFFTKQKILILIIIFLLVLNISTIVSIVFHLNAQRPEFIPDKMQQSENQRPCLIEQRLDFSEEQKVQLQNFRNEYREKMQPIMAEMHEIRYQMLEALAAEPADTTTLFQLASDLGSLHTKMKHNTFSFYFDVKSICNEQQQVELLHIFRNILARDDDRFFRGDGPRHRRGRGGPPRYQHRNERR